MFSCDGCVIERNADIAVLGLYGSMLTLDHTLVRDTAVSAVDQLHGDGVVVVSGSSALVIHSAIMNNARAGIAAFAALVSLSDTELSCNGFDLAGELYEGVSSTFEDGGNNRCGCPADDVCKLVSAGLTPPAAQP
jgi:hypothetical protein